MIDWPSHGVTKPTMPTKPTRVANKKPPHTAEKIQQVTSYIRYRQRGLYLVVGIGLAVAVGIFLWHQHQQEAAAQREIFQAVYDFEAGNFTQALQGNGTDAGFLDIIQEYSATKAANLAHFYAGVCCMHQRDYAEAIQHLKQFKAQDYLLQARAWALIGDAYTEQQQYPQATVYYLKAADYKPNAFFTPTYLAQAALAYEAQQDYPAALQCYQRIVKGYPQAAFYGEACKHASRLAALL